MLSKSKRLKRDDFPKVARGKIFRGTYLDIRYVEAAESRFACVISKKTIQKAVDRNKVRRRIYSYLNTSTPTKTLHMIVYPKKNSLTAPFEKIKGDIIPIFDTL